MEISNLALNDGNVGTIDYSGNEVIQFVLGYGTNPTFIGDAGPWSVEIKHFL